MASQSPPRQGINELSGILELAGRWARVAEPQLPPPRLWGNEAGARANEKAFM